MATVQGGGGGGVHTPLPGASTTAATAGPAAAAVFGLEALPAPAVSTTHHDLMDNARMVSHQTDFSVIGHGSLLGSLQTPEERPPKCCCARCRKGPRQYTPISRGGRWLAAPTRPNSAPSRASTWYYMENEAPESMLRGYCSPDCSIAVNGRFPVDKIQRRYLPGDPRRDESTERDGPRRGLDGGLPPSAAPICARHVRVRRLADAGGASRQRRRLRRGRCREFRASV